MTTTILAASNFDSSTLGVNATTTSQLLQQTGYNKLNATPSTAINIGNLITNKTQLTTNGGLTGSNPTDYYSFNLTGTSIAASFSNVTQTTNLRYQITNSKGVVIADNQGTAAQQTAFTQLTSKGGLTAASGKYTVQISYAPISQKGLPQNYGFQLYSGTSFSTSYETTAKTQTSASQYIPVNNTGVWADAAAQSYTKQQYNKIAASFSSAINIGWLAQNNTALAVTSQLTTADNADYYQFAFQNGTAAKLAFNNTTSGNPANTPALHVQLYDSTGTSLIADNQGTTKQKAAYASLTSSSGLQLQNANYVVKVSNANGSNLTKTQNYNFQLSAGTFYKSLDTTTASAQTVENAILSGTYQGNYNAQTAAASYISGGQNNGILSIIG